MTILRRSCVLGIAVLALVGRDQSGQLVLTTWTLAADGSFLARADASTNRRVREVAIAAQGPTSEPGTIVVASTPGQPPPRSQNPLFPTGSIFLDTWEV